MPLVMVCFCSDEEFLLFCFIEGIKEDKTRILFIFVVVENFTASCILMVGFWWLVLRLFYAWNIVFAYSKKNYLGIWVWFICRRKIYIYARVRHQNLPGLFNRLQKMRFISSTRLYVLPPGPDIAYSNVDNSVSFIKIDSVVFHTES